MSHRFQPGMFSHYFSLLLSSAHYLSLQSPLSGALAAVSPACCIGVSPGASNIHKVSTAEPDNLSGKPLLFLVRLGML